MVIIGGGAIGCAIAYYLRKLNLEVTVLEQGDIASNLERKQDKACLGRFVPQNL